MSRTSKKEPKLPAPTPRTALSPADFEDVLCLIDAARGRAVAAVNQELIDLYWNIGEHISCKIAADGWGKGTVEALAEHIRRHQPNARGFSAQNLWRMRQFYETYRGRPELAALLRELSWSHNLAIMSRSKRDEEREFYLRMVTRERWSFRELQRQLDGALFERTVLAPPKLSTPLAELHPEAGTIFKDTYLLEFLDFPPAHFGADLQLGLVRKLKQFLIELAPTPSSRGLTQRAIACSATVPSGISTNCLTAIPPLSRMDTGSPASPCRAASRATRIAS